MTTIRRHRVLALPLFAAIALGACSSAATGSVPPAASAAPSAAPATPTTAPTPEGALAHPTGANEIIFRYDETGGFVPIEFLAAHVPYFTLYGDGTVVFVQTGATLPERGDGVMVGQPIRTTRLSEDQIQKLLVTALRDGGLAIARESYQNPMVADAPTAVFTINADNDTKTVSVNALGMEGQPGPDTAILKAMSDLAASLRDFDKGGALATSPYQPPAYVASLTPQQGVAGVTVREWPWKDLTPADFTFPADANALQQGTTTITPAQAEALGIQGYENGVSSGVWVKGADGTVYSLALRPVLPDQA